MINKDPYTQPELALGLTREEEQHNFQELPISKLIFSDKNPRTITNEQFQKLKNSLLSDKDFLIARPICVNCIDGKYHIYAGNQRVRAAKKLGWKKIWCCISHNLSQEIIDQRCIKDNKTYGEFDFDELANSWEIDLLLDSGFLIDDFAGVIDEPTKEKKESKLIKCPKCEYEFKK